MLTRVISGKSDVEDFNWHPTDPHLLASVASHKNGGGSLQLWRINDLLTATDEELNNNEYLMSITSNDSNNNNNNSNTNNTNVM